MTLFNNSPRVAYCFYHNVAAIHCSGNVFLRGPAARFILLLCQQAVTKTEHAASTQPIGLYVVAVGLRFHGCHSMGAYKKNASNLPPLTYTLSGPLFRCSLQAGPFFTQ